MNQGILIILINVVAWLAFFIGAFIAIFRHVRRRGRVIMLSGVAVVVALIVTLVALSRSIASATEPPQIRPSPSGALLTATWFDSAHHQLLAGVSGRDGAIRWRASFTATYRHAAPTAGGLLYVEDGGGISALRLSDGARLWSVALPPQTSVISPLVLRGGALIYVSASGGAASLNALDLSSHAPRWSVPLSAYARDDQYSAFAAGADMAFLGSANSIVSAVRLSDGALAWTYEPPQTATYLGPDWVVAGDSLLYAFDASGHIYALRQTDGAVVWREPAGLTPLGQESLTVGASTLYACGSLPGGAGSALAALDPATGALRWQRAGACRFDSLLESDGVVFQLGDALTALRASDGHLLWRATAPAADLGFTSVQVDHGVVFAAASVIYPHVYELCANWWSGGPLGCHSEGELTAFDGATGAPYWRTIVGDSPWLLSGVTLQ